MRGMIAVKSELKAIEKSLLDAFSGISVKELRELLSRTPARELTARITREARA